MMSNIKAPGALRFLAPQELFVVFILFGPFNGRRSSESPGGRPPVPWARGKMAGPGLCPMGPASPKSGKLLARPPGGPGLLSGTGSPLSHGGTGHRP
jgi:hypothetical protein